MFKRKTVREQLIEEQQKNAIMQAQTEQNTANIEYIAIISDIPLGSEGEVYE